MGKDTADMFHINSQVCQYKEGKELFTYLTDLKLANVWKLNARFVTQSTSASCCESNWSNCEYIFSKLHVLTLPLQIYWYRQQIESAHLNYIYYVCHLYI